MTQRAWLVGWMSVCALSMVGCGEDDPKLDFDDLPAEYASAICDAYLRCLGAGAPKTITPADCLTENIAAIQDGDFQHVQDAIDAGRIKYRATRAHDCVDALRNIECADLSGNVPTACEEALVGTAQAGELCGLDEECASGLYCRMTAACPGTCTARGVEGDVCEDDDQCARGFVCGSDSACHAPAFLGQACSEVLECAVGLACLTSEQGGSDTCVDVATLFTHQEGDACFVTGGAFELCQEGLTCAGTRTGLMLDFTCEPPVTAGAACKLAVPDQCPEGQFCDLGTMPGAFTGTCTNMPTDGQPCGNAEVCAPRNVCTEGMCHAINRIGGECTVNEHCASERCVAGACVAPMQCDPDA